MPFMSCNLQATYIPHPDCLFVIVQRKRVVDAHLLGAGELVRKQLPLVRAEERHPLHSRGLLGRDLHLHGVGLRAGTDPHLPPGRGADDHAHVAKRQLVELGGRVDDVACPAALLTHSIFHQVVPVAL